MKRFHLSVGLFDILKWEMFLLLQAIPRAEMQQKTRNTSGVVHVDINLGELFL